MSEDPVPRYYRTDKPKRNAFWAPGKFAEKYDLPKSQPLGPHGADAKSKALKWNERLDAARKAHRDGIPAKHPPGSLGSFYANVFKQSEAWALMEPRTREQYERAWPHIEKRFGRTFVMDITANDSERFHVDLHPQHENPKRDPKSAMKLSWFTANLVLKHFRLLLTALVDYGVRPGPPPIGRVSNPNPPSRAAVWTFEEMEELTAAAKRIGEPGMALAILIGWETMMSTVDVRRLSIDEWKRPAEGAAEGMFSTTRKKSGAIVRVASTPELDALVGVYIATHRKDADGSEPLLLRGGTGEPFRDRHSFKEVFAKVREAAFPGDRRQFGDMRRSGATEAKLGGANDKDLGATMANRLADDEGLQSTYNVSASKKVRDARRKGRAAHSAQFRKNQK